MKICHTCQQTYSDDVEFCPHDGARLALQATETEVQLAAGLARRYRIVRRLGQGGMGTVFLVEQIGVGNRLVAIKVLNGKLLDDPDFLLRFQNEAASTGRIHHPNVVTIYESAQADDGTPYIAMEFLEGESLRQVLQQRGALPVTEVAEILEQAARGLNAAHKLGIIHRDLKPDNIFLTHGDEGEVVVKVVDFGIAKLRESALRTALGNVLGTPAYMSYEQAYGMPSDQLDGRSDVYSLGIVAYEMLAGRVPFHSDTPQGYLRKHILDAPPPFRAVAPGLRLPPQIEAVVMRALTKDRDQRWASALEFSQEFTRASRAASEELSPTRVVEPLEGAQAEAGRLAGEKVERERQAREQADAERREKQKADAERVAREQAERERAEQERGAREQAEAERQEKERAEAERLAREKAEQERQAREQPAAERPAKESRLTAPAPRPPRRKRRWIMLTIGMSVLLILAALTPFIFFGKRIEHYSKSIYPRYPRLASAMLRTLLNFDYQPSGGLPFAWLGPYSFGPRFIPGRLLPPFPEGLEGVIFTPDGSQLLIATANRVQAWDVTTGRLIRTVLVAAGPLEALALSPNGEQLGVASGRRIAIADLNTGAVLRTLITPALGTGQPAETGGVQYVAFSPDGRSIATAGYDVPLALWDSHTGKKLFTWWDPRPPRYSATGQMTFGLAFSPDGAWMALGVDQGDVQYVKLWRTDGWREAQVFNVGDVANLAFTRDSRSLAIATRNHWTGIWDLQGNQVAALRGSDQEQGAWDVSKLAFDHTGQWLATFQLLNGTVRIWELSSARLASILNLPQLSCFGGMTEEVVFSPDSRLLVVGFSAANPNGQCGARLQFWKRTD
jgi:serine/threonine-protein kinase